jgi:pantetheine-phosphate adenylyltransferase
VSTRIGLYPGSFDPVTYGHVDIVRRAAHLVDKLVIAIGTHHDKHPLFTAAERVKLTSEVLNPVAREIGLELEVTTYDNLTVDAARSRRPRSSSGAYATPAISTTRCRWPG